MQKGSTINVERLKETRLFRQLTMDELANIVGINKQAISQFGNRKSSPEPFILRKIADALGFPYSFLQSTILYLLLVILTFERSIQAERKLWFFNK